MLPRCIRDHRRRDSSLGQLPKRVRKLATPFSVSVERADLSRTERFIDIAAFSQRERQSRIYPLDSVL